jgi:hypothetical protein
MHACFYSTELHNAHRSIPLRTAEEANALAALAVDAKVLAAASQAEELARRSLAASKVQ